MKEKFKKLTEEEFNEVADSLLTSSSNVPKPLLIEYKKKLFKAVKQIESDVYSEDFTPSELREKILKYLSGSTSKKAVLSSDTYLLVDVPVLIPFEFAGMLVFFKALLIFVLMQLVDEIIKNGLIGMRDVSEILVKATSGITTPKAMMEMFDSLPKDYKKEDLN